jgi:hypothetical protein
MVTLWNSIRIQRGAPAMGFIAPFLYAVHDAFPAAFQDVTTGNNACGAGHSLDTVNCCDQSFAATPGWDAVTGLGTPNFKAIANFVQSSATLSKKDVSKVMYSEVDYSQEVQSSASTTPSQSSVSGIAIAGLVLGCVSIVIASAGLYVALSRTKNQRNDYEILVGGKHSLLSTGNF